MVQVPIGDDGTPSRRICLVLTDGSVVPITVGYRPDADGEIVRTAEAIRKVLGLTVSPSAADSAKIFVDAGHIVDAIRLLRQEEGLTLNEAKRRVDDLRSRRLG